MDLKDMQSFILAERMAASNTTAQEIAKSLLKLAAMVEGSCDCTPMSNSKVSKLLHDLACEIDTQQVVWDWNLEEIAKASGLHPKGIDDFRAAERIANRGRSRVAVREAGDWRGPLGFAPGESPSEEDLDQAFKQRARETHPDKGGDPDEFVRAKKAHELAKEELFGKRPGSKLKHASERDRAAADTTLRCPNCHKPLL